MQTNNMILETENTGKIIENKKDNKKASKSFIVIMILSMLAGGIIGGLSTVVKEDFLKDEAINQVIGDFFITLFGTISPFVMGMIGIVGFSISIHLYRKCRTLYKQGDKEDEALYEKIEKKLSYAIAISSSILVIDFFFFEASTYFMVHGNGFAFIIPSLIIFLGSIFILVLIQQKIVDFEKEMNPEKKGSIYDMKFQSKWMDSCDEAEQLITYKSAFAAYRAANKLCIFLMVSLSLLSLCFKIGLLPAFVVTMIWFSMQIVFVKESMRLSNAKTSTKMQTEME